MALQALNEPVSWWGWHGYSQPQPLTITQILAAGNLSPEMTAIIWLALEHGASIVVASDPPSSGKTTTLSALLPFFPRDARLYFTRGLGESFELPEPVGSPIYLMVNEISDHLPVYSWGSHVQRIFELMSEGYALASTMHCDTVDEVIDQLTNDIGVSPELLGHLTLVVPISVEWHGGSVRRRALEVALLRPTGDQLQRTSLAQWSESQDEFLSPAEEGIEALADYLGRKSTSLFADLTARASLLSELLENRAGAAEIEEAIFGYRFEEAPA